VQFQEVVRGIAEERLSGSGAELDRPLDVHTALGQGPDGVVEIRDDEGEVLALGSTMAGFAAEVQLLTRTDGEPPPLIGCSWPRDRREPEDLSIEPSRDIEVVDDDVHVVNTSGLHAFNVLVPVRRKPRSSEIAVNGCRRRPSGG
jgi:hypothetical protein